MGKEPVTRLDTRFSSADATATDWAHARKTLHDAEVFWVSTVRQEPRAQHPLHPDDRVQRAARGT